MKHDVNYQTAEELTRNHVNCSGRPHRAGTDGIVSLVNELSRQAAQSLNSLANYALFIYLFIFKITRQTNARER